MTFEDLKNKYPDRDGALAGDFPKPNREVLDEIIEKYGCRFPPSFIDFQLKYCHEISMGDYSWDGFGWANKELPLYMSLEEVVKDYKKLGFPDYLTPFRRENGDFWCFDNRVETGSEYPVVIWDKMSGAIEEDKDFQWKNFIDWLDKTMEDDIED